MWRLWMTLVTGVTLTGAFQAYSVLMSPAIRVPKPAMEPEIHNVQSETHRPAENVRVARTWLKDLPWVADAKSLLRTDEMFIYTNKWKPDGENGLIRFEPFAGVWLSRDSDGKEQAVTINAASALLKFESSFEIDKPQLGRVTGGSLYGEVHISGPDGLEIDGENFLFTEATSSIRSDLPISFRFGENQGKAGKLQIQLLKADRPVAKDRPNIIGVKAIQLRENVRMELKLDEGETNPQPAIVYCTGSFEYQVETRTSVFDQNVVAYRRDALVPTKFDRIGCDRLTVQFEPKETAESSSNDRRKVAQTSAPNRNGDYQHVERNLQFRSMKAEGERVRIDSSQQALSAMMKLLTYDAKTRTIEMQSPQAVRVKQRLNQLQSPYVKLVLGEQNRLVEALCRGAGWLESYDEQTGEIAFAADWMKQLRKSTDPETQLDLIELEQDASFRQPTRETGLSADLIRLWFTPPADSAGGADAFRVGGNADPKRLLALKNVALVSPQVEADAEQELEVLFEGDSPSAGPFDKPISRRTRKDAPITSPRPRLGGGGQGRGGKRFTALPYGDFIIGRPIKREGFQGIELVDRSPPHPLPRAEGEETGQSRRIGHGAAFASVPPQPPAPKSSAATDDAIEDLSATPPALIVAADRIRVRMYKPDGVDELPEIQEIWTTGHVRVEQPSENGGAPLTVTGERLHVEQESATRQIVHVYGEPGRPAHVRDEQQQLHIEGPVIHLDRGENLAWVEGAGLLQLPVPKAFDGKDLTEPQLLDVWWRERMDFDGLLATFAGDVRAKLADGSMQCQSMQVALSSRISFHEPNNSDTPVEIQSITCRDGVKFENHRYQEGRLMEIQWAKVFEFHLDHAAHRTEAQGPGWMQMWQRGSGRRAGLVATESVQANRTSREPATEWEFTRVDFSGRMTGQIDRRRTSFHDRVNVIYGPVLKPIDMFDKHTLPKEGGWMRCKSLQVVQTIANADEKSFVQLIAAGNTFLEGRGFTGSADFITFDETLGKYVLRSLGHGKAKIWREKNLAPAVEAQQLEFFPATSRWKVIHATGGEGVQ